MLLYENIFKGALEIKGTIRSLNITFMDLTCFKILNKIREIF